MRVRVRLFAIQRQQAGWRERDLDVADGATVAAAWDHLVEAFPVLASGTGVVRFARNAQYVESSEPLVDGDELAVIPPVAGGDDAPAIGRFRHIELRPEPIDDDLVAGLRRSVSSPADGAVVVFVGQTRESPGTPAPGQEAEAARHAGRQVQELGYEAFDVMAIAEIERVADEVEARFDVHRMAVIHRTGTVPLGEASVVICVASPHRGAAFDACRYAIDELKARVPIWKAEHFADGSVWIGEPPRSGPTDGA